MAYVGTDTKECLNEESSLEIRVQSDMEDADLYGFDVMIRGDNNRL